MSKPDAIRRFAPTIAALLAAVVLHAVPAAAKDLPAAKPADVGLSAERLKRLDAVMQAAVDQKRVAGIVALVARHGRVAHHKAYGMANIESSRAMRNDDMFRLYSMTKPLVSVALLMLYEEGKFQLSDPLEQYIPEFRNLKVFVRADGNGGMVVEDPKRKPTIQDALRHTLGLTAGGGQDPVNQRYRELGIQLSQRESLREVVQLLGQVPLLYQPGERWVYGLGHDVQAHLVEHFSGMSLDQFMKKRMFEPLGMTDAVFGVPQSLAPRFVTNYRPTANGGLEPGESELIVRTTGPYERFTTRPFGSVGVSSTTMDFARVAQMLLNGGELDGVRVLGKKTVELMVQNHLPPNIPSISSTGSPSSGYGLGLAVAYSGAADANLSSPGTFGWTGAATTRFFVDPKEGLVAIIHAQQTPSDRQLLREFQTLVYQSIVE